MIDRILSLSQWLYIIIITIFTKWLLASWGGGGNAVKFNCFWYQLATIIWVMTSTSNS